MNKVLKRLSLKGFETAEFPTKLCISPSPRSEEEGVMESHKYFVCVVINGRFTNQLRILLLRPYIWTEPDSRKKKPSKGVLRFGWVDESGNIYGHNERATNAYDHVVAWKPA